MKADLHNHLGTKKYTGSFNKSIDISKEKLSDGGVLGVVNFSDLRYETFVGSEGYEREQLGNAIYVPEKGIYVIKGQEIATKQGHLLVVGLKWGRSLKDGRGLEDTLKEARDNNGVIIAAHPFVNGAGDYIEKNPGILELMDGIEIHNGEAFFGNKKARDFYSRIKNDYDIGGVSFSDGHSLYEIGSSYTWLEQLDFKDSEAFVSSLRKAIRAHKDFSKDKKHNSIAGMVEHAVRMASIVGIQKLGFNKILPTYRDINFF